MRDNSRLKTGLATWFLLAAPVHFVHFKKDLKLYCIIYFFCTSRLQLNDSSLICGENGIKHTQADFLSVGKTTNSLIGDTNCLARVKK